MKTEIRRHTDIEIQLLAHAAKGGSGGEVHHPTVLRSVNLKSNFWLTPPATGQG